MIKPTNKLVEVATGRTPADVVFSNAQYLNVFTRQFETGDLAIVDGYIAGIGEPGDYRGAREIDCRGQAIVPGFIDAHIHLESTQAPIVETTRVMAAHGTTALIADPHEMANVLDLESVAYLLSVIEDAAVTCFLMAPSCVPSCPFDETGAVLDSHEVAELLSHKRVIGLAEVMNYPGVIGGDVEVHQKIQNAQKLGKVIDGHAPCLSGLDLNAYVAAGPTTDHESTTYAEAYEKLRRGQYVLIREGTAGRNLAALQGLLTPQLSDRCLFCSDDIAASDLLARGHLDYLIRRCIELGTAPEIAYAVASFNAAKTYRLADYGALAPGYRADLVLLNDIETVDIAAVWHAGVELAETESATKIPPREDDFPAVFHSVHMAPFSVQDIATDDTPRPLIGIVGGEIITENKGTATGIDVERDILKLCVVERHKATGHIGIAYATGYGLKRGAIATSVAHDAHNIIAIGTNDADLAAAIERVRDLQGGHVLVEHGQVIAELPLPIAGLISDVPIEEVARLHHELDTAAHECGVLPNVSPLMTLSFLALPVIPHLKLTTLGVVDVDTFSLMN
ncbi:MAG: adenine deaminase [Coriobacteriia bacterium]|nr:adenine deaminase [Coriobacteriia bacterium]